MVFFLLVVKELQCQIIKMDSIKQLFPATLTSFRGTFVQNKYLSYPKGGIISLKEAVEYCHNNNDKGFDDWRLPTFEELADYIGYFPADFLDSFNLYSPYSPSTYFFITKTPFTLSRLRTNFLVLEPTPSKAPNDEGEYLLNIDHPLEVQSGTYLIDLQAGEIKGIYQKSLWDKELSFSKFNCICIRNR
jgi:hypothetical protein